MLTNSLPSWFPELLQAAKEKAGSRAALARALGTRHPTIMDWEDGAVPGLDKFLALLSYVDGDINRALPTYAENDAAVIRIYGRVSAGAVSLAAQDERVIEGDGGAWRESTYRRLTRGSVIYLEVMGNSMEPDYPDASLLACARPAGGAIPDLTPVIARVGESATFKLYRLAKDRRGKPEVELIPINRSFDIQRYDPRDVSIDYIALGFLNPWKHGVESHHPRPQVLRER